MDCWGLLVEMRGNVILGRLFILCFPPSSSSICVEVEIPICDAMLLWCMQMVANFLENVVGG